ncbi:DUF6691 family protein [Gynuella sunshinyii]|uniref:Putative transporter component n=1 Tax=Gynuella sunshinyii YC6258 TaxID=1445510 RepID=A0A0C5VI53_9GAMM|nr:DUF6691 family protein [Gynuella sunshinyii]AJQ93951.1 putative transporter component [Gynuella sunshinyii YC6258]
MTHSDRLFARISVPLISGVVFGLGLLISGMNNPGKIRGFLDILGAWQPQLIAVMIPAVIIFGLAFRYSRTLKAPWLHDIFHMPSLNGISLRLLAGATLFGIGWGLIGLCPGPVLVDLASFQWPVYGFLIAMIAGNRLAHHLIGPAK